MSSPRLVASINPKILLVSLAIMLLSLALPIALLQTYDRIIPNQSYGTAWVLALGVLIAILLEALLRYGRAWILNRQGMRFEAWSAVKGVESVLASKGVVTSAEKVNLMDGFGALKRYQDYHSGQALVAVYDAPFVILFLVMIAYIGGYLVVIPLVILALAFLVMYILSVQAKSHLRKAETTQLRVNHFINHVFEHVFSFRATASQRKLVTHHNAQQAEQSIAQAQADKFFMHMQLTTTFFAQATTVLIVMLSAHYVIEGQMTSGALAACTLLAGRTMAPVSALFSFWGQLQKANSVKDKAQAMLDNEHRGSKDDENKDDELKLEPAGLVIDSVMLPGSKSPTSINIKPGELLYLEERGTERFAGVFKAINDDSKLEQGAVYCVNNSGDKVDAKVAVIGGKMHLFSGSVLDNLTLFDPGKNERAKELCQKLGLHKRIIKLPQGFETQIGNQKVSGLEYGVEQQIAIARAFLANPSLIILNHADAGLDFEAQKALVTFLKENNFQSTVVVTTFSEVIKSELTSATMQKGEAHE